MLISSINYFAQGFIESLIYNYKLESPKVRESESR
jgi:hypothetical protein